MRRETAGVAVWTDPALSAAHGVCVAFSERVGGASVSPFATLNLASHVGDDPVAVEENRTRLLHSVGLEGARERLVMSEQVHGERIAIIDGVARRSVAVEPATDCLVTRTPGTPLLMCFADCVPVVLVATAATTGSAPAVAVAHAGWRGAQLGLPGKTALALARFAGCGPSGLVAYIGAHIGACHYEVGEGILSQFVYDFGTFAQAESGGLDLGAVVSASLTDAGVDPCSITSLGTCTFEATDRFFSYRAEDGLTGRHGALACILTPSD